MSGRVSAGSGAAAVAALGGNLTAHSLPVLPGTAVLVAVTVAACLLLCRIRSRTAGVALLSFALTAASAGYRLADRWSAPSARTDVSVHGWIDGFPQIDESRAVFTLRAFPMSSGTVVTRSATGAGTPGVPSGGAGRPASGSTVPQRIRLSWYDAPAGLEPGTPLELVARIRPPRGLVNPGGFDYERWLLVEAIGATGYVREGRIALERQYAIAWRWMRLRAQLADRIRSHLGGGFPGELVLALALGVRTGFDEGHWDVLRRTGTSHLVAISGLHIGLVAAFAFQVLLRVSLSLPYRCARQAWTVASMLTIVPAAAYAALAGFALPTLRALVMIVIAQLVILSRQRISWGAALSTALFAVLALSPMATLGASFWLSFGAVVLILAAGGMQTTVLGSGHMERRRRSALSTLLRIQLVLALGLMPISLASFGEVSIAALVVNLVAVPVFSLVLVPLSLLLAVATLLDVGTVFIGELAVTAAGFVWKFLDAVASWEHAAVELRSPATALVVVALLGVMLVLSGRPRLRWLALVAMLPLFFRSDERLEPGAFVLTVLDVGHGLAVVVRTRSHVLLYDTGPLSRSGFDAGREIVAPALRHFGIGAVDRLVLSHGDSDHAGGFRALAGLVPGSHRLLGPDVAGPGEPRCRRGQGWVWDQVTFSVLHPSPDFLPLGNESSCVVRIETRFGSALLTGDIEDRAEAVLVNGGLAHADLVVVAHHGSATSSTASFVRTVGADYAVVSAAFANRWNFPRPEVRARWTASGAELITTGHSGAVHATVSSAGIDIGVERDAQRAYWRAPSPWSSGAGTGSAL